MIVTPYVRNPEPPIVAVLVDGSSCIDEHGDTISLDLLPKGHRVWAGYDTVHRLVGEGEGEALCWNNEEIRWRHRRYPAEAEWVARPSDVSVIRLPLEAVSVEAQVRALARWRDWLASYGAAPVGTTGSAAWSLLRARLIRKLVTGSGERPPFRSTSGGRQQLGPAGAGSFEGSIAQYDLPAAYASTLASLRYGGVWLQAGPAKGRRIEDMPEDAPVFLRARVRVPRSMLFGPLLRRSGTPPGLGHLGSILLANFYPRGLTLQGVWTREEVMNAERAGCGVRILDGWVHRSAWHPFTEWWLAVQEGRAMHGLEGQLAKMTGNALYGRFAMDPRSNGIRTIRTTVRREVTSRRLPAKPFPYPAHDLAETVCGRVRAELHELMEAAGTRMLSAHTDGVWVDGYPRPDGWRQSTLASRIDILGPQTLRYFPVGDDRPSVVYSGVSAMEAEELFEREWVKAGPSLAGGPRTRQRVKGKGS